MIKQKYYHTLFLLGILLTGPLHAVHHLAQEGQNDANTQKPKDTKQYDNYTLQRSKKRTIDNRVFSEELKNEKNDLSENNIMKALKDKKGAVFLMVIVSNKTTNELTLTKLFFINRNPNTEESAVWKVQRSHACHVITPKDKHVTLNCHVALQLLGWLQQEEKKYIPIHIHASEPLCVMCHAIVLHLFHLDMPKSSKGCSGASAIDLEKMCPLAKTYLNSGLTLRLAKQLFLPKYVSEQKDNLRLLEKNNSLKVEYNKLKKGHKILQKEHNDLKNNIRQLIKRHTNITDMLQIEYKELRNKLEEELKENSVKLNNGFEKHFKLALSHLNKHLNALDKEENPEDPLQRRLHIMEEKNMLRILINKVEDEEDPRVKLAEMSRTAIYKCSMTFLAAIAKLVNDNDDNNDKVFDID